MRRPASDRTQATVYTGRTDFQKQFFCVFGKFNFLATLQYFDRFGQIGLQPFGADLATDLPDLFECLHHFATIDGFLEPGSHVSDGIQSQT